MLAVVLASFVLALSCALVVRAARGASRGEQLAGAIAVLLAIGGGWALLASRPAAAGARSTLGPRASEAPEWVTSSACLACHPGQHASFARTFHRTMTQRASLASVLAPLDGRELVVSGEAHRLVREGEDVVAHSAAGSRRVALVTGSHREQAYWLEGDRPGELVLFPFVWMARDSRFVARREAFLLPPEAPMPDVRWGSSCIACHAVAGEPRRDAEHDRWDTRVAELGITCEACHGPGRAHVERYRDPFARYARRAAAKDDVDPTIVDPRKLSPARSAALCGQCHAYAYPRDEGEWWKTGYARAFRAGDTLERSRFLLSPATFEDPLAPRIEADVAGLFWPDGTVRVGGREYNGLVASPCFERGEGKRKMTCTSCHAMHEGDPRGQLAPSRVGDAACTSCHDDARARGHGHHAAGSSGNACVACHMPRTSYALLSATRSHRISSPSARRTSETGEPNACNLCHLDRSLAWTAEWLSRWYGTDALDWPAGDPRKDVAEGVRSALVGDAAVRVIVADALARPETAPVVDRGVLDLARRVLARDPYAAVRYVATKNGAAERDGNVVDVLVDAKLRELFARRDTRPVMIAE